MNLSPSNVKNLLYHILSGKEFGVEKSGESLGGAESISGQSWVLVQSVASAGHPLLCRTSPFCLHSTASALQLSVIFSKVISGC